MSNLSRFVTDKFLGLMGGDENRRQEIVGAIEAGSNALSNIEAGSNVSLSLVDGVLTISASGGGGGSAWGSITGTLSAQTDLQSALDLKANTSLTNLTASTAINQHLMPASSATYDLGSPTKIWRSIQAGALVDTTPTVSVDIAARNLSDTTGAVMLNYSGGAAIILNTKQISGVVDPTSAQQAATKNYVDTNAGYIPSTPSDWAGTAPTTVQEALNRLAAATPGA